LQFIKISESKNRRFPSFEKKKKTKIRIRELMGFSYFRNIKESKDIPGMITGGYSAVDRLLLLFCTSSAACVHLPAAKYTVLQPSYCS